MTEEKRDKLVAEACPYCRLPVAVQWTSRGIVPSAEYILVADWVYHANCWDKQVAENPPVTS
jgi:hypothetical protein